MVELDSIVLPVYPYPNRIECAWMKSPNLTFVPASAEDVVLLSQTAYRSKMIWAYSAEQMDLWIEELTLTAVYIQRNYTFKMYDAEQFVGFLTVIKKGSILEIDHLWLLPGNLLKGYGKEAFRFICKLAAELGCERMQLYAEPHAKGFYERMGGKVLRRVESKIPGRFLEIYEFRVGKGLHETSTGKPLIS